MSRRLLLCCGNIFLQPGLSSRSPRLISRPTAPRLRRPFVSSSAHQQLSQPPSKMSHCSHPVTEAVVKAMQELYPLEYADSAWDNVGLLLDNLAEPATPAPAKATPPVVLLTNDLTSDVVDEAIELKASTIVAYHPFIFRGLKSVTHKDPQQTSLLRLAQHNISVYSPHTALDAAETGINDWLVEKVCKAAIYLCGDDNIVAKKAIVKKVAANPASLPPHLAAPVAGGLVGYGRQVFFHQALHPYDLINTFVSCVNAAGSFYSKGLNHVLVAKPRRHDGEPEDIPAVISSVAVCAGSGMDILRAAAADAAKEGRKIDMFITGEVSHHDALWASENGIWVVCMLHSNSERFFLRDRLQSQLQEQLQKNLASGRMSDLPTVLVSNCDRDPFEFVSLKPTQ